MAHNACLLYDQTGRKVVFGLQAENEQGRRTAREKQIRSQYDRPHRSITPPHVPNRRLSKGR